MLIHDQAKAYQEKTNEELLLFVMHSEELTPAANSALARELAKRGIGSAAPLTVRKERDQGNYATLSLTKAGTVDFNEEVDSALLPAHLAVCLRSIDADAVEVKDNCVTFAGGIFRFVGNWNVLVPFGFGNLTVESDTYEVRYCLSYRQLIIISTTIVGFMGALAFAFSGLREMFGIMLGGSLMWFFGVFGNLAIGISRFQKFISNAIATAPRLTR